MNAHIFAQCIQFFNMPIHTCNKLSVFFFISLCLLLLYAFYHTKNRSMQMGHIANLSKIAIIKSADIVIQNICTM